MSIFDYQDKTMICLLVIVVLLVILCIIGVAVYKKVNSINKQIFIHYHSEMYKDNEQ